MLGLLLALQPIGFATFDERGASTGPSKTSYSSAGGSTCSDGFVDVLIGAEATASTSGIFLKPWKDSGGDGCAAYKSNFWSCDARGYDKDGHSAKTACCHCGGGQEGGERGQPKDHHDDDQQGRNEQDWVKVERGLEGRSDRFDRLGARLAFEASRPQDPVKNQGDDQAGYGGREHVSDMFEQLGSGDRGRQIG